MLEFRMGGGGLLLLLLVLWNVIGNKVFLYKEGGELKKILEVFLKI